MERLSSFVSDCAHCQGFCCRALFFFKQDGFPSDKVAGANCQHLQDDYRCTIHNQLQERNYYGCLHYDCLGAGQKTAKYQVDDGTLFEIFAVLQQLQEILWYLFIALNAIKDEKLYKVLENHYQTIDALTKLPVKELLALDLNHYRSIVNPLLQQTYLLVNHKGVKPLKVKKKIMGRADLMGCDLTQYDLVGQDFKGAFLIKANLANKDLSGVNFLGSDVRDMNICGSNLTKSLFLTPMQLSASKGDDKTILPNYLKRPHIW